jgi:hypothetical protein
VKNQSKIKGQFKLAGIILGILAVAVRWLTPAPVIEQTYSRSIFLHIRSMFDTIASWLPVAWVYPFFVVVLAWLGWRAWRFFSLSLSLKVRIVRAAFSLLAVLGYLVFFFLMLWGFNYGRVPLHEILHLDTTRLTTAELRSTLDAQTEVIATLQLNSLGANPGIPSPTEGKLDMLQIRAELESVVRQYGFPVRGRLSCRELWPAGLLMRFGTSGIYFPFTGEGHIDRGLHWLQKPVVTAHEMAHGLGFGDEGACDFWAYLACTQATDPALRYSGELNYWRHLATAYKTVEPEQYQLFRKELPAPIIADLDEINATLERYPDIMPWLRDFIYDHFLKSQGIEEGLDNYDSAIPLIHSWRKQRQSGLIYPTNN